MHDVIQRSFKWNLFIMRIAGLYPTKSFRKLYKIYSWIYYVLFTVATPTLAFAELFIHKVTDFEMISDTVSMALEIAMFIAKLLPFIVNVDGIEVTLATLHSEVFTNYLPEQQKYVNNAVNSCNRCFHFYWKFCIASLITWVLNPFLMREHRLPINIWVPFDIFQNQFIFAAVFLFTVLGKLFCFLDYLLVIENNSNLFIGLENFILTVVHLSINKLI